MDQLQEKYSRLGVDSAPGQEDLQEKIELDIRGEALPGTKVDFSHGDVNAHIPTPGALDVFIDGYKEGANQAYTEYRGQKAIREIVAEKLSAFTGSPINAGTEIIVTPGTQCALFLAMGALVGRGDKVAIVEPDYFANRKLAEFFDGDIVPIQMHYVNAPHGTAGIDLTQLEEAFKNGVKLFLFSNPNNPTGVIYSKEEIATIASLAKKYNVSLIVDELYSRQIFDNRPYTHLRAQKEIPESMVTILGPSKTESLSGFRLGVAFGSKYIIDRMEKLQAIVSLRAAGYCQAVLKTWFNEPEGFMAARIKEHQDIRDSILALLKTVPGTSARPTEGGSYLFVELPELTVSISDFVKIVRKLTNTTVTTGTEFGPQFTNHFRINFSQNKDDALDAIKRLLTVMERYRK